MGEQDGAYTCYFLFIIYMTYSHLSPPQNGQKIGIDPSTNKLNVPDYPVIPFIEGDGTGRDIWRASVRVFDAAVKAAYKDKRRIEWFEVYAGEKSYEKFKDIYKDDIGKAWLPPDTLKAFQEYLVGIKGPLTTPVGAGIRSLNVSFASTFRPLCLSSAGTLVQRHP